MIDGVKKLMMKNVVVVIRNVVVEKVNDGKSYVVVNCINGGTFNDHGQPHFRGR